MALKLPLAVLLSALVSAPSAVLAEQGMRGNARRANAILAEFANPENPGCAVGVYRDGMTLFEGAYGLANLEHRVPIDPQKTVFEIGSVSKQFTAASILLLAQDGKLALSDDIRKYLPEFPDYGQTITIEHLLHHTSGLRDYPALRWMMGGSWWTYESEQDILDLIARQRGLNFQPGSQFTYSNSNYVLLAQIVRRVSGKSLASFAKDRIFAPLGMTKTYFEDTLGQVTPHLASGYARLKDSSFEARLSRWMAYGDGGLQTTLADLAKWQRNFDEPKVGGAWLIQQLEQKGTLSDGTKIDYARGLEIYEEGAGFHGLRTVVHNGGTWDGFRATVMRLTPYRISIAVLCNSDDARAAELQRKIADLYIKDKFPLQQASVPVERTPLAVPVSSRPIGEIPATMLGSYWNRKDITIRRIEISDGKLWYVRGPESRSELALLPDGRLQMLGVPDPTFIEQLPPRDGRQGVRIVGRTSAELERVAPVSNDANAMAEYAGVYTNSEFANARITLGVVNGALVPVASLEESTLTPVFKDGFSVEEGVLLVFQRDASGRVVSLLVDHLWARNMVFTRVPGSSSNP